MSWTLRRQRIFGWVFLVGLTVFYALENQFFRAGTGGGTVEPAPWQLVLFWTLIGMTYLPAYWVLAFSNRKFGWTLREWGFGFSRRSWLVIGFSLVWLIFLWRHGMSGRQYDTNAEGSGLVGVPFLLFEGYARIAEELIYRGFALVFLCRFLPRSRFRVLLAVLVSSFLFSCTHTQYTFWTVLNLFLFGAVPLAAITVWGRSLSLALVAHGAAGGGPVGGTVGMVFFLILALIQHLHSDGEKTPG